VGFWAGSGSCRSRVEDEGRERGANYVQAGRFKAFAMRHNQLITGQQQYSRGKVAELVIDSLGV
jgi:putative intracellular protease/amidase